MEETERLDVNYFMDEFGRVIIQEPEILKQINGAGESLFNTFFSNSGCGSNGACANAACK